MFLRVLYTTAVVLMMCGVNDVRGQRVPRPTSVSIQVHGQVRYPAGERPAEFLLVRLESFRGGVAGETTTDRSGRFTFTGLSPELYIVSVRTPGYVEVKQQVDLRTQISDYILLQLVPEPKSWPFELPPKRGVVDANVPEAARSEFEKGRDAILQANNLDKGILLLEHAVRIYPKYIEALLLLGTAYMDKQEWPKAETTLTQVVTLDDHASGAHFALGELYLRQKKYVEAEKDMLAGIHLEPKSVQGHFLLARLYYEVGDLAKAGPHAGTALQLNPKFARGHLLAGNILLHARQTENALIEFEEYLHLEPKGEFAEQTRQTVARIKQRSP
jgi:Tfp pilus assembly protein PilF